MPWKVFASTAATKPATPDVTYTYRPSGQVEERQFQGEPVAPHTCTIREDESPRLIRHGAVVWPAAHPRWSGPDTANHPLAD